MSLSFLTWYQSLDQTGKAMANAIETKQKMMIKDFQNCIYALEKVKYLPLSEQDKSTSTISHGILKTLPSLEKSEPKELAQFLINFLTMEIRKYQDRTNSNSFLRPLFEQTKKELQEVLGKTEAQATKDCLTSVYKKLDLAHKHAKELTTYLISIFEKIGTDHRN